MMSEITIDPRVGFTTSGEAWATDVLDSLVKVVAYHLDQEPAIVPSTFAVEAIYGGVFFRIDVAMRQEDPE